MGCGASKAPPKEGQSEPAEPRVSQADTLDAVATAVFRLLDEDGDGKLTPEEARKLLTHLDSDETARYGEGRVPGHRSRNVVLNGQRANAPNPTHLARSGVLLLHAWTLTRREWIKGFDLDNNGEVELDEWVKYFVEMGDGVGFEHSMGILKGFVILKQHQIKSKRAESASEIGE